jgi:hypothetical protein
VGYLETSDFDLALAAGNGAFLPVSQWQFQD